MGRNRLAETTSPYLLQHKDNPVHWWPWGPEALAEAKETGKPILLSVGYAACHWCHVMAHESFENDNIAAVMNDLFINIKVDREERPDIDAIYMNALHMLGEQGGWPLTMFLDPDGKPFFGGTYFPPEPRYGRPGFVEVLENIARIYKDEPDRVAHNTKVITEALASRQPGAGHPGGGGRAGRAAARRNRPAGAHPGAGQRRRPRARDHPAHPADPVGCHRPPAGPRAGELPRRGWRSGAGSIIAGCCNRR